MTMKQGMKDNIERKQPSINDVVKHNGFPLFSFIELNINELCNRKCPFCPRVNPKIYPNQNIHMDMEIVRTIADQLKELNFTGIVNISGTGEPLLTRYIVDIIKEFGDRNIHVEIVTNGDMLTRKTGPQLIKDIYKAGLGQFVVSMYDGPEQIEYFNNLFSFMSSTEVPLSISWIIDSSEATLSNSSTGGTGNWINPQSSHSYITPLLLLN